MRSCPHCEGFVPEGTDACPNCDRTHPALRAIVGIVVGGILATTLMACYGGPPHAKNQASQPPPPNPPASSEPAK